MLNNNDHTTESRGDSALFRLLLECADDLLLATDADLRLVYVSRSLLRVTPIPEELLLNRTIAECGLFAHHAHTLHERLLRAKRSVEQQQLEIDWTDEDSHRIYSFQIQANLHEGRVRYLIARARDVSEQRRIENDLREREREFRTLAENSPDNIIRYGLDLRAIYCNREIEERVLKVSPQRIVGRRPSEAAPPGMRGVAAYEEQLARTLATGESGMAELIVPNPQGELTVHSIMIAPEHDASGAICGAVAVGRDVSEQVRAQQALLAKEREFRTLAENAGDNIARWDPQGRLLYANPAMSRLNDVPLETLIGNRQGKDQPPPPIPSEVCAPLTQIQETIKRVAREGNEVMLEVNITPPGASRTEVHQIRFVAERDESGRICSVLGFGRDISEKLEQLELIESLVSTDPLTRLANRQALQERAPGMLKDASRQRKQVAVMLLDLDEFKSINDGMGHSAGDEMLCEVAQRLSCCLRSNDLLVRLGGDEFVFVAPDLGSPHDVEVIVSKLHEQLAPPLHIGHRDVRSTASIGIALYPQDGEQIEQLLAHADTAMYQAKRTGRARTEYYRDELGDAVRHRLALEDALHKACDGNGLELYYQPQFNLLEPESVVGAEALLRWHHPTLGFLSPDQFIALAEETGAIVPIGRWVLRSAAQAAARWNQGRERPLHLAVNVSTRQFIEDDLPALIDEVLTQTGCSPHWLWIEITESALLQDSPRVQQTLEAFRQRGVRIALDDFGTGYSALNYLTRFPVECLKIDRSFVHGIGRSHRDDELVKAFIAMASALNLTTVAEGVETAEQTDFLLAQGCPVVQGFRFGRPVSEARFMAEFLQDDLDIIPAASSPGMG